MYRLSDDQVAFISHDIRARGIRLESLHEQLLDHVCCLIEEGLADGADFHRYYESVIRDFYEDDLAEIEKETFLLLTFKNYYTMRKLMMGTGAFAVAAFVAGSFLKLFHLPGAGVLLVSGMGAISLIFLPLLLLVKSKELTDRRDRLLLAIGTVMGMLYCMSALFLVHHWPGARIIWFSTLILSFFVFTPVYFFTGIRYPARRMNTMVVTILLIAAIGIQFTLTALRPHNPENRPTAAVTSIVERTHTVR